MITIAWDIDDVLNDLMRAWLEDGWAKRRPECKVRFQDIMKNPPHEIIGATFEEYHRSLDDFRLSPAYPALMPEAQVLKWFQASGHKARHLALSSVSVVAAHVSAEWVVRNFGKWIRSFNFVPSSRPDATIPQYDKSKADYLKWFNRVDLLIEDSQENALAAQKAGIKAILVAKPWNDGKLSLEQVLLELDKII